MAINPIQPNIEPIHPYRDAEGAIDTSHNVKPLPAEGHLVHDRISSIPKFFIQDMIYDAKAVRDGFKGDANDHQCGRLNDVGLKLSGVGIATYLATKTTNPVARVMEYAGLGAFLTAMALYPQIAIQAPSRALHGFDSGKEYIDDQGRKKSVFQDQNYIPFDMYRSEFKDEDLDIIGDKLGVPRDIQNRHELIKEQMRKIAIQNNTLWMLSAGFATPVVAAIICYGLEKLISPAIAGAGNLLNNSEITNLLNKTQKMAQQEAVDGSLSKQVAKILTKYEGKELPKEEFDKIVELFTKNLDANASEGIKEDIKNIIGGESKSYIVDEGSADKIISNIKNIIPERNRSMYERLFLPSKEELNSIIGKYSSQGNISEEQLQQNLRKELKEFFDTKISAETNVPKEHLNSFRNNILANIETTVKKTPSKLLNSEKIPSVTDMAKIIGEFKVNEKALDTCKLKKFEHHPETMLARSYAKFEKTLLDILDIKFSDLKAMRESEDITREVLENKLAELTKDEAKYEKAIKKLSEVMKDMEVTLNGKDAEKSYTVDLINAIENNYNNTAKRLNQAGGSKFRHTIDRLVKEDVSTLSNSVTNKKELFDMLDGIVENKPAANEWDYAKANAKGVGSSKRQEVSKIVERYQGVQNSFNRIIHAMDAYKKFPENTDVAVAEGKKAILSATSSEIIQKLYTVNSPEFYKRIMWTMWDGNITDSTRNALGESNMETGNITDRFTGYLNRFREVIGSDKVDFTKPHHNMGVDLGSKYAPDGITPMSKFNLTAQSPVDFVKKAAERRYGTGLWLRRVSIIGGTVLGATLLAQLGFGKIKNPHNVKKQVSNDTDK